MPDLDLRLIAGFLQELWDRNGSDLLIAAGAPPLVRVDGALLPIDDAALTPEDTERIVSALLGPELSAELHAAREIDLSFNWNDLARFRTNAFYQRGAPALSMRVLPFEIPSLKQIGLPAIAENIVRLPQGLVLITGPTGSGKSTTLASMIDTINQNRRCHIVTIEDPIEYVHTYKRAAVSQRELGIDTLSFARALRSVLREDPDVLLVGEMRDPETIAAALTIAETGHLVFASLHTNDAAQTIDRIVDVFPAEQQAQIRVQLAGSLQVVLSQRLVPRISGGRVAAFEVLVVTHAVRHIIRDGRTTQLRNLIMTGAEVGMQTLESSLSVLIGRHVISTDEALNYTLFPKEIGFTQAPKSSPRLPPPSAWDDIVRGRSAPVSS